ncbi:MAG: hypothetical protein ACRBG0_24610 [Lewinella sp.]|uniref:hypothetical protein n=1 Tax=Lewinella sp. TaxID=2004506 RepID=UPI003D6B6428
MKLGNNQILLKVIIWLFLTIGLISCSNQSVNESIYESYQNYDYLKVNCSNELNLDIILDTLQPSIMVDGVKITHIFRNWSVLKDSMGNRKWVQMVDTNGLIDISYSTFGFIQLTSHSYNERINLNEFFTGTLKTITDSVKATKKYNIIDHGVFDDISKKYWIVYERKDKDYGNTKTLSYYWLNETSDKVFQLDISKLRGVFNDNDYCQFLKWINHGITNCKK